MSRVDKFLVADALAAVGIRTEFPDAAVGVGRVYVCGVERHGCGERSLKEEEAEGDDDSQKARVEFGHDGGDAVEAVVVEV